MAIGIETDSQAADPVAAAREVAPLASALADRSDQDRRLTPELVQALRQSGLFRMLVPSALGGAETSPWQMVAAVEELARGDAAAGWCVSVAATSGMLAAYLPEHHAAEVFGDPEGCAGGVFAPKGRATPSQPGTLAVTGRWSFASGVQHCDWLLGGCMVAQGEGVRRLKSGAPDVRMMLIPAAQAQVIDTWAVSGLRGTGSHDFAVQAVEVPAARSVSLISDAPREQGPLYTFPAFGLLALAIAGVGMGIARGAIQDLVGLADSKTPAMATHKLADQPDTRVRVARAEAELRAARALVASAVEQAWDQAAHHGAVDLERRAGLRLAASHAMGRAAHVVDEMYSLAGGSAVYDASPLQRRFRDVHVATQHMLVNPSTWDFAGRVLLGAPVRAEQF